MDKRTICLIIFNLLLIILLVATKRKNKLKNFIILVASVVFTLSVTEFVYRLFLEKKYYHIGDLDKDYFKYDSSLGYTINRTGTLYAVKKLRDDTMYSKIYNIIPDSTQPHIDYNHRTGFQNPDTTREIVFLGCSVTFGVGLDDTACLAYKTGKLTQLNTVNLGCQGYGMHQVYQLFLNKYAGVSNANRVFVYSFIYDHILRANGIYEWNIGGPFFKVAGDSLIRSGSLLMNVKKHDKRYIHYLSVLSTFSFLKDMLSNIYTRNRVDKLQQADFDRCFLMIKNMADIVQRTGGKFILIDWGRNHWNDKLINEQLFSIFEKQLEGLANLHIIKVASVMDLNNQDYFIPDDGHPSALANDKLATSLSKIPFY